MPPGATSPTYISSCAIEDYIRVAVEITGQTIIMDRRVFSGKAELNLEWWAVIARVSGFDTYVRIQ